MLKNSVLYDELSKLGFPYEKHLIQTSLEFMADLTALSLAHEAIVLETTGNRHQTTDKKELA